MSKSVTKQYVDNGINVEAFIASHKRLVSLDKVTLELPAEQMRLLCTIAKNFDKSLRILEDDEAGHVEYSKYKAKALSKGEEVRPFEEFRFGGSVYGTTAFVSVNDKTMPKNENGDTVVKWTFNKVKAGLTYFIRRKVVDDLARTMAELAESLDEAVAESQMDELEALTKALA